MRKYYLYQVHYEFEELGIDYERNVTAENEQKAKEYLIEYLSKFSDFKVNVLGVKRFKKEE